MIFRKDLLLKQIEKEQVEKRKDKEKERTRPVKIEVFETLNRKQQIENIR